MITDAQQYFSSSQALTATAASTNLIDLNVAGDLFPGEPLDVQINVNVAADFTTGDETYAFSLETDDNAAFSSPLTILSKTVAAGSLTLGSKVMLPIPNTAERYLRVKYTLGGTTPSVTTTAFLTPREAIDQQTRYPRAYSA